MATELITATGSCKPGDKDFNGAANFLADKMADNGVQATAKTSQIFLGMAVQCTQCHNHPFNEYQQNQFWELNAFFRQTHVEKRAEDEKKKQNVGRVVDKDFKGEGGDPKKAEIYYELRNGKLKVAYPVFVDGTSLARCIRDERGGFWRSRDARGCESARGAGEAGGEVARVRSGDRESAVGAFPGLWVHEADGRHRAAQSAVAPGAARRAGQVVPRREASI